MAKDHSFSDISTYGGVGMAPSYLSLFGFVSTHVADIFGDSPHTKRDQSYQSRVSNLVTSSKIPPGKWQKMSEEEFANENGPMFWTDRNKTGGFISIMSPFPCYVTNKSIYVLSLQKSSFPPGGNTKVEIDILQLS